MGRVTVDRHLARVAFTSVVALLVLVACSGDDDGDAPPPTITRDASTEFVIESGQPIVIGVSTALTGPAGVRGREYRDAVVLAVEDWKRANGSTLRGHEIVVVAEDDGCTAVDAASEAARRHAARPGLVGVLGPQCSAGALAVAAIYAEAGIVTISGSATASAVTDGQSGGFMFRTAYRNDYQGVLTGIYASQFIDASTAIVIDDSEAYGLDLAVSVERSLVEVGVAVERTSITQGRVDFSELAASVAADAPDMVFFAGFNPEAALILRQLRDAGWTGVYTSGDAVCGSAECEFLATLGEVAEGVAFSGCAVPTTSDFVARFEAVHGDVPTASFVPQYVDATRILLDAVAVTAAERIDGGLVIDPRELRATVAASTLNGGVSGDVLFDAAGDRTSVILRRGAPSTQDHETLELLARALGLVPCFIEGGEIAYFDGG
jgi:branched-chain amino acid transport system substrate-binding protein